MNIITFLYFAFSCLVAALLIFNRRCPWIMLLWVPLVALYSFNFASFVIGFIGYSFKSIVLGIIFIAPLFLIRGAIFGPILLALVFGFPRRNAWRMEGFLLGVLISFAFSIIGYRLASAYTQITVRDQYEAPVPGLQFRFNQNFLDDPFTALIFPLYDLDNVLKGNRENSTTDNSGTLRINLGLRGLVGATCDRNNEYICQRSYRIPFRASLLRNTLLPSLLPGDINLLVWKRNEKQHENLRFNRHTEFFSGNEPSQTISIDLESLKVIKDGTLRGDILLKLEKNPTSTKGYQFTLHASNESSIGFIQASGPFPFVAPKVGYFSSLKITPAVLTRSYDETRAQCLSAFFKRKSNQYGRIDLKLSLKGLRATTLEWKAGSNITGSEFLEETSFYDECSFGDTEFQS